jgi:hypothetical protein
MERSIQSSHPRGQVSDHVKKTEVNMNISCAVILIPQLHENVTRMIAINEAHMFLSIYVQIATSQNNGMNVKNGNFRTGSIEVPLQCTTSLVIRISLE